MGRTYPSPQAVRQAVEALETDYHEACRAYSDGGHDDQLRWALEGIDDRLLRASVQQVLGEGIPRGRGLTAAIRAAAAAIREQPSADLACHSRGRLPTEAEERISAQLLVTGRMVYRGPWWLLTLPDGSVIRTTVYGQPWDDELDLAEGARAADHEPAPTTDSRSLVDAFLGTLAKRLGPAR